MSNVIIGDILPYTQAVAILNQTVFGTNWTADVASNVVVYQTPFGQQPSDELFKLNFPADYSVDFIGALLEVQVTLTTPAGAGDIITITRQTPADRLNIYTNTNFTPSMLNNDFEILTLVDQQAQLVDQLIGPRYNYSAIIAPNSSFPNANIILPILGANQIWVKNNADTEIIPLDVPSSGFAPADASYVLLTPDASLLPNSFALSSLGAGLLVNNPSGTNLLVTTVAGTTNQIGVINGTGASGNVTVSIVDNPILPGTSGMGIPAGTTGQRVVPTPPNINLRFNTTLEVIEYFTGGVWIDLATGDVIQPGTQNDLAYYAATGNTLSPLPTTNDGVLITSNTGVPSWLANSVTPGFVLTANAGAPPSWQSASASGAITTIDGDSGSITPTAGVVTISGGSTGLTTNGSGSTLDLTGTLAIAHGGTGVTSVTISPTASAWAGWDANKNFSANNFISGYTTTPTAASTTTLTVASTYQQFFTGITTQIVAMPLTSTLVVGQQFQLVNNSSGNVTVNASDGSNILTMTTQTVAYLTCISTGITSSAAWYFEFVNKVESTGTVTSVGTGTGLTGGPITTTGTISLVVPVVLANGGTNASLTASNGGIVWSNASQMQILAGTATAGLALLSGANGAPTWSTKPPITNINIRTFTSGTSTYIPSTGLVESTVSITGSGAGGGGAAGVAATSSGFGGGGGGGGTSIKTYTAAQIGASATIVVGAPANGGAAGANNGTDGNSSTFTPAGAGVVLTATGGTKGLGGTATTTTTNAGLGGNGGTGTNGDLNISGSNGMNGIITSGAAGIGFGGHGGGTYFSPPTFNNGSSTTGTNGVGYGAGGSGGFGGNTTAAGGNSFGGICYIIEYISI